MVKGAKGKVKNKNVVGNGGARNDASIEEMQKDTAAAAGLDEVAEANSGHAAEESTSLVGVPLAAAPAEGEDELDPLAALLAAQADPAVESADVQQVVAEQAAPQDGAEVAAPVLEQVRLTKQEQIELRNSAYEAEAKRHAAKAERAKQVEQDDRMDYDQADWYEASGGAQRTGPGVGCGHFDSDLTGTDLQADKWGRNYRDVDPQGQKRWTNETENLWEQKLADSRKAAQKEGGT